MKLIWEKENWMRMIEMCRLTSRGTVVRFPFRCKVYSKFAESTIEAKRETLQLEEEGWTTVSIIKLYLTQPLQLKLQ